MCKNLSTNQNQKIRLKAMDLLARREHSKAELQQKLIARGFDIDEVETVIQKLAQENLQSDARFTACYTKSRTNRGFGPLRIRLELNDRGITDINTNINPNDTIWFDNAITTCQKKFGNNAPKDLQTKAKQIRFLQYKGFTGEQIKCALTN